MVSMKTISVFIYIYIYIYIVSAYKQLETGGCVFSLVASYALVLITYPCLNLIHAYLVKESSNSISLYQKHAITNANVPAIDT